VTADKCSRSHRRRRVSRASSLGFFKCM